MDYWSILAIQPTQDKRKIKKAYSAKLKNARPDVNKEAFQNLHSAYKYALHEAQEQIDLAEQAIKDQCVDELQNAVPHTASQEEPESLQALADSFGKTIAVEISERAEEIFEEKNAASNTVNEQAQIDPEEYEFQQNLKSLLEKTETLLSDRVKKNQVSEWEFISTEPLILNTEFNNQLAYKLFGLLADYEHNLSGIHSKINRVSLPVLLSLNEVFLWTDYAEYYSEDFLACNGAALISRIESAGSNNQFSLAAKGLRGASEINYELDKYEQENLEYYFASITQRLKAFWIDFILTSCVVFLVFLLVMNFIDPFNADEMYLKIYYLVVVLTLVFTAFYEGQSKRASFGKQIMGLRVITDELQTLSLLQSLWRKCALFVTWGGFYYPLPIISWFINDSFDDSRQMHDKFSKTYVVDYKKSKDVFLKNKYGK